MITKSKYVVRRGKGSFCLFSGFTLIELLVVMSVIAVLAAMSLFALQGARESARDTRRKADLETIRSGLELYRSDCGGYPAALPSSGASLTGTGDPGCPSTNVYIREIPGDPIPGRDYAYIGGTPSNSYTLCAALEEGGSSVACGGCGSAPCNYVLLGP